MICCHCRHSEQLHSDFDEILLRLLCRKANCRCDSFMPVIQCECNGCPICQTVLIAEADSQSIIAGFDSDMPCKRKAEKEFGEWTYCTKCWEIQLNG